MVAETAAQMQLRWKPGIPTLHRKMF